MREELEEVRKERKWFFYVTVLPLLLYLSSISSS